MSNNKVFLISIAIIIVAVLSIVLMKSYAKYNGKTSGNASMDAAVAITETNVNETLSVNLEDMVPGDTKEYNFAVMNYDATSKVNEVKMNYSITIDKSNNLPLNISLYKNLNNINILDADNVASNNILSFNEMQIDNYVLVIDWDISSNSYEYSDMTDFLDINIRSEQVTSGG